METTEQRNARLRKAAAAGYERLGARWAASAERAQQNADSATTAAERRRWTIAARNLREMASNPKAAAASAMGGAR